MVWTDTLQAAIMFGSFLFVVIYGNFQADGWDTIAELNWETDRIEFFK